MSWIKDKDHYQQLVEQVESVSIVETKDKWYWKALYIVGLILTLGLLRLGFSYKTFMQKYAVTLATRQGYPANWNALFERTLWHEARHTTQYTWFGWVFAPIAVFSRRLRAWFGLPIFALVYFVLPFPVLLAAGRFYLELDADRASWRLCLKHGLLTPNQVIERASNRASSLSNGAYLYAWPASWAHKSYIRMATKLIRESLELT